MATSVRRKAIKPDGGDVRRSSGGKPIFPKDEQNKLPDYARASSGSCHYGGYSRRYSTGKLTTPDSGKSILANHIRASTGYCNDVINLRRNSTGKRSSRISGESGAANYLRASTSSCHDVCKYGATHAFEVKARRPVLKRVLPPSDTQSPTEFGVPAQRRTTMVVKPKHSPASKTHSPSSSVKVVSSPSKKVAVSLRQASSNEKKIAQKEKIRNLSEKTTTLKPKTMIGKPSSFPDLPEGLNGGRQSEIKIAKKTGTSKAAVKKILASPAASLSPKPSVNRITSLNVKKNSSLKLVSPLKDQNRIRKAESKQSNCEKVTEKTLHVIMVETNKVLESTQTGECDNIHPPLCPTLASPESPSLPKSPALPFHKEEVQEEFEYSDSELDDQADDSISERSETVNSNELETSEGNHKRTPRKAGVVGLPGDNDTPAKMKFRRGKVVDLLSENKGPRRLRFRQGRVLVEHQDSIADGQKRSFKKRVQEDTRHGTNLNSEKVVLRHQDEQGKKDAQGLFNNVIEETASKLVESRKSKVKALVGAFESVISLQDRKF